jgi:hypothetical protein
VSEKKMKKIKMNGFPAGKPAAVEVPACVETFVLCAMKSYFKDRSLKFTCTLGVGGNLFG